MTDSQVGERRVLYQFIQRVPVKEECSLGFSHDVFLYSQKFVTILEETSEDVMYGEIFCGKGVSYIANDTQGRIYISHQNWDSGRHEWARHSPQGTLYFSERLLFTPARTINGDFIK